MPSCEPKQEAWRPPLPGLSGDPPVVAFSITKVLTAGAVVIAPPGTVQVNVIEGDDFTLEPVHVMVLIVGLLGFVAFIGVSGRAGAGDGGWFGGRSQSDGTAPRRREPYPVRVASPVGL